MSFIRTPTEINELVDVIGRLIAPELGTFANGLPAIWVEPPDPPADGKGLHCFIYYRARQLQTPKGLHQSIQTLAWNIALRQTSRDIPAIEALVVAGDKIRNGFSGCTEGQSVTVADRMPMLVFNIPFSKIVNPTQLPA